MTESANAPICGACNRPFVDCKQAPCVHRLTASTVVDIESGRIVAVSDMTTPIPRLRISKFDPGEHFYLRRPGGLFPGGDRFTDHKFDSIDAAIAYATLCGYPVYDYVLVINSIGDESRIPIAKIKTRYPTTTAQR